MNFLLGKGFENLKTAYCYDLEKGKRFVEENDGMWEVSNPPAGVNFYLAGTIVFMCNDWPTIDFEGDIRIARKLHEICFEKRGATK